MIFEGDIVRLTVQIENGIEEILAEVRWHMTWLKWALSDERDVPGYSFEDLGEYDPSEIEAIGNIHDDGELMGGNDA